MTVPDRCSKCGSPLITLRNDSDMDYWAECRDCGTHLGTIPKEDYTKEVK